MEPMFDHNGRALPGSPAARLEAEVGTSTWNGLVQVHAGDLADVAARVDPKIKIAAEARRLVAVAKVPGEKISVRIEDVKTLLTSARSGEQTDEEVSA